MIRMKLRRFVLILLLALLLVAVFLIVSRPRSASYAHRTADPRLPGGVDAADTDGTLCHLTVDGAWLWQTHTWDGYTPEIGDGYGLRD